MEIGNELDGRHAGSGGGRGPGLPAPQGWPLLHFPARNPNPLGGKDPQWPFAGKVVMIGRDQFPQIFAGATLNSDGSLTIYCTRVTSALKTAIAKADTDGTKYTFMIVPRSFATLEQTTLAIAHDGHMLRSKGVSPGGWGPDPAHGQVKVHLTKPSASQMKELASTLHVPASSITLTTYPRAVQTLLQRQFGKFVVVSSTYKPPSVPF